MLGRDAQATLRSPAWSYRLTRSPEGHLIWTFEDATGRELRYTHDPGTSWWGRFKNGLLGLLPIEGQI